MKIGKYKITTKKQKQRLAIVCVVTLLILVLLVSMIGLMVCGCLYIRDHLAETKSNQNSTVSAGSGTVVTEPYASVILDPGHGGSDGGAIYEIDGKEVIEKDIDFNVTLKVKKLLEDSNIEVILTRDEDVDMDLKERTAFANATDADLFVSLHCNYYEEDTSIYGLECYYEKEGEKGKSLAENIMAAADASGQISTRELRTDMMYVVRFTDMPSTLVEMGFLTSEKEGRKLCSDSYQDTLAQVIAEGILQTLDIDASTDGEANADSDTDVDEGASADEAA